MITSHISNKNVLGSSQPYCGRVQAIHFMSGSCTTRKCTVSPGYDDMRDSIPIILFSLQHDEKKKKEVVGESSNSMFQSN